MPGSRFSLEVQPRIPAALSRIEELANNLFYTWDRNVRALFYRLDKELWADCGHRPKVFLRRVSQQRLEEATRDRVFLEDYNRVMSSFDTYHHQALSQCTDDLNPKTDMVAYFCAEFGLHESLPIYSGGLGILAGDHCKAASDLGLPFVAVGLLYRQGYFSQTIDSHGNQIAQYMPTNFSDLPLTMVTDDNGSEIRVTIPISTRDVHVRLWKGQVGRITMYLLDTDITDNNEQDRSITHQLYGGDRHTRIQQEIVLGIGGVRALAAVGIAPTAWHINEGHAAFQILERCRRNVGKGLSFDAALEIVAAGTVFTTHTPVQAGHDMFDQSLIENYLHRFIQELNISTERLMALGSSPGHGGAFNMTALALRGSRFHNGVSRIHGEVASRMEGYVWPQVPHDENPIDYVTNGVHIPTFLAREWVSLFDMHLRDWRNELTNEAYWSCIDSISDQRYWSVRQSLKAEMLQDVWERVEAQYRRNGASQSEIHRVGRVLSHKDNDVLTIGFARRFATYKRAALLFSNPERLARILGNSERPVLLLFAGKAHPHDLPGQNLIKIIHDFSRRPEFQGRLMLLEGYDMALARKLVTGVDVWLNTPEYPLEASGTSGEKAGINGVINLSVLDGWWGEGYRGDNGWAVATHGPEFTLDYRNREESADLLDILEHEIVPLYYDRNGRGYPEGWVRISKNSMRTILPNFNAERMVTDYVRKFYGPATRQCRLLGEEDKSAARELANWKNLIAEQWPRVQVHRLGESVEHIKAGQSAPIQLAIYLGALEPRDVVVECLVGTEDRNGNFVTHERHRFEATTVNASGEWLFRLDLAPKLSGLQYYKIRLYPHHRLLAHAFETGLMIWL